MWKDLGLKEGKEKLEEDVLKFDLRRYNLKTHRKDCSYYFITAVLQGWKKYNPIVLPTAQTHLDKVENCTQIAQKNGEITSLIFKDSKQNMGQWHFLSLLRVVNKNHMNRWKNKILSHTVSAELFAAKALLSHCSPSYHHVARLAQSYNFLCSVLCKGRYGGTPGHNSSHKGAGYLIPALAWP